MRWPPAAGAPALVVVALTLSLTAANATDWGESWTPLAASEAPMRGYAVTGLAVDPQDHRIVVAAANNGVFRTTDGGATWTEALAIPPGTHGVAAVRLGADPVTGDL